MGNIQEWPKIELDPLIGSPPEDRLWRITPSQMAGGFSTAEANG